MCSMVAAAGLKNPRELQPHHLMHRAGPEKALPLDRINPFLPDGILRDAPRDTIYAEWWEAAQPGSFDPATDLLSRRASTERNTFTS